MIRTQHGFTVIELISVLFVASLSVAMAGPGLAKMLDTYRLRGGPRELYAELQRARGAAVTENNRFHVTRIDSTTFQIHDDDDGDARIDAGEAVRTRSFASAYPGLGLSGAPAVTFAPNGSAPASGTIVLSGRSGQVAAIAVSAAGRIQIH